jgi:hypothetical protein
VLQPRPHYFVPLVRKFGLHIILLAFPKSKISEIVHVKHVLAAGK